MKKAVILGCLVLFLTPIIWAQEKVESPVWKVGDKWTSRADNGWELTSEIIADEKDYYLSKTVIPEGRRKGEWKRFYSKKDFNLIRSLKDGKEDREDRDRMKKNLDFPLYPGKKWSYRYTVFAERVRRDVDMLSELKAVGFEDVEVPAGKFRAIKVQINSSVIGTDHRGTMYYWWCPEVKGVIKFEFEPGDFYRDNEYMKVELVSFNLK